MDPVKVAGVKEWPVPQNVMEVQSFLGFLNFYRQFVEGFSQHAHSLFELTRKSVPFEWTSEATAAITWALGYCQSGCAVYIQQEYINGQWRWDTWADFLSNMKSEFLPIGERTRHAVMLQGTEYYQGCCSVNEYIDTFCDVCREAGYAITMTQGAEAEHLVLLFR